MEKKSDPQWKKSDLYKTLLCFKFHFERFLRTMLGQIKKLKDLMENIYFKYTSHGKRVLTTENSKAKAVAHI